MDILTCDGTVTGSGTAPTCSGDWVVYSLEEFASSHREAYTMTPGDFGLVSGYLALWFLMAFGIRLIRRNLNS